MSYQDPNSNWSDAIWMMNVALAMFIGYLFGKF